MLKKAIVPVKQTLMTAADKAVEIAKTGLTKLTSGLLHMDSQCKYCQCTIGVQSLTLSSLSVYYHNMFSPRSAYVHICMHAHSHVCIQALHKFQLRFRNHSPQHAVAYLVGPNCRCLHTLIYISALRTCLRMFTYISTLISIHISLCTDL